MVSSLEAEQGVLGAVLIAPETMEQVYDLLLPDDFANTQNRFIFKVLQEMHIAGQPIDLVTLANTLKEKGQLDLVGGPVYLTTLTDNVGTAANAQHYAKIIYDRAAKQRLVNACQKIFYEANQKGVSTKELIDLAEAQIFAVTHSYLSGNITKLGDIMRAEQKRLLNLSETVKGGKLSGVPTGLTDLNAITFGWQPGDMIVVGGRPGHGKTALALNCALAAAQSGAPSVVFSLEMTAGQLVQRLFSLYGDISGDVLRSGNLEPEDIERLEAIIPELAELPLTIVDGAHNILDIKSLARRVKAENGGLGLVVIDYLGLVKPVHPGRSRYEEVTFISRSCKALAQELKVPVLVCAQLNRKLEDRKDRRPILSDLRDSGDIEQDADLVLFIYRDELYNDKASKGVAELLVRKQRSGKTGNVKLYFEESKSRFKNYIEIEGEEGGYPF